MDARRLLDEIHIRCCQCHARGQVPGCGNDLDHLGTSCAFAQLAIDNIRDAAGENDRN